MKTSLVHSLLSCAPDPRAQAESKAILSPPSSSPIHNSSPTSANALEESVRALEMTQSFSEHECPQANEAAERRTCTPVAAGGAGSKTVS